ncbi:ATP-dependent helicase/nuclease subunit A [Gossypium arboreum]|uniref:ATP-dependent helicase/nuclease subunit A n=1 Tax=Gossypium arboreum TaxID=29729 RepID=A0A0B0P942_GOSAR|nr:ATP-dependent helicase/nuclease subunit A [Gossypium arboreum]
MVDLYNVGIYNANTGFNAGYLNELERILEKVLPHSMLKAKPNLESRIRLLKRDWAIVYACLVEKTVSALVGTSIGRWLLLKMLCGTHI